MSKRYLENVRNINPVSSQTASIFNHKLVMNLKGPNFIGPAFANITYKECAKVEGVVHELTQADLDRIVTSEGKIYELIEAPATCGTETVSYRHCAAKKILPKIYRLHGVI